MERLHVIEADQELTELQLGAVRRPAESRTLVVAPAGTGKTAVLIARLEHLIHEEGLSPGREVLILSFSRAAVGEISRRLRTATRSASYARAATFDSFATSLLETVLPDGDWVKRGYDGRIAAATEAIRNNPAAAEELAEVSHVLVDEIQDLVGVRRELVGAVLETVEGGFTLLGDPAQAIYDWQENDRSEEPSQPIVEWMSARFEYQTVRLDQNFRALSDTTKSVLTLGELIVSTPADPRDARAAITGFINGLPRLRNSDEASVALKNRATAAVLCRTNGQALTISEELHRRGVEHRLQRRAMDRAIAPWVGSVLRNATVTTMAQSMFERLLSDVADRLDPPPADDAWRLMKRLDPGNPSSLDIVRVAQQIRLGIVPDELTHTASTNVVVSTVHRAKGLEFDNVIVVEPRFRDELSAAELVGELRVAYVGLSRARHRLLVLHEPDTSLLRYRHDVDRWIYAGWKQWERKGIEIRGSDVHADHPAGSWIAGTGDASAIQEYLVAEVRSGDPVTLSLFKSALTGVPRAFYAIDHGGRQIGLTGENFARDLYTVLKVNPGWEVRWPPSITNVRIDSLDTVAGTSAAGTNANLGVSGIWLRPRLVGLARFQRKDSVS